METMGARTKALRKRLRLSLDELAKATGSNKGHLSMVERDRTNPSADLAVRLARELGVTAQWLVAGGSLEDARDEVFRLKYLALSAQGRARFRAVISAWKGVDMA